MAKAVEGNKSREKGLGDILRVFSLVMEQSREGISLSDLNGNILYINPAFAEAHGYRKEELIGKHLSIFHTPEQIEAVNEANRRILEHGEFRGEIWHTRKDGKKFPTLMHNTLIRDEEDRPIAMLGTLLDITDQKDMEKKLRASQKMEAVGRLAGGIAHDFNNILGAITGYTDLVLIELNEGDPLRGDLKEVQKAAQRAAKLTRQLLAFSRRQMVNPKVIHLNSVVADLERMLYRLIGEDIKLSTTLTDDNDCLLADPGQVEQVIMNLCVKARDAMPDGGKLSIETSVVDDTQIPEEKPGEEGGDAERYVLLQVGDTGCGMDDEIREKIFEPFFTTKEEGQGTGLGLSTVYGIVSQCNGVIDMDSNPGEGTIFRLYFPQVAGETVADEEKAGGEIQGVETVLVVEDEPSLLQPVARMLRKYGYRTLEARNAGEALLICEKNEEPIEVLLTDMVMPRMDGREMAGRLIDLHPEMKILFMSGYPGHSVASRGLMKGEIEFIAKPFSAQELAAKVREVLDKKL